MGGVYSAGGQLVVEEQRKTNNKRRGGHGLFNNNERYAVSKKLQTKGVAYRRHSEIKFRKRINVREYEESEKESTTSGSDQEKHKKEKPATRRTQLIPRVKLRTPLPFYCRLESSINKTRGSQLGDTTEKSVKNKITKSPQIIRMNETLPATSHLHSEKIRIAQDAAVFEIKRESKLGGNQFSSRYEIYNSTTRPFGKSYRELTLSSSTSNISSCGSSINSSSSCSETTTYVTCTSEIEPVQMTAFQTIQETMNDNDDDLKNKTTSFTTSHQYVESTNTNEQISICETNSQLEKNIIIENSKPNQIECNNHQQPRINITTWPTVTKETEIEPLKSPKLIAKMIETHHDLSKNADLQPKQNIEPIINEAEELEKKQERQKIMKTISVLLENRKNRIRSNSVDDTTRKITSCKKEQPTLFSNNDRVIIIDESSSSQKPEQRTCRVTSELLKTKAASTSNLDCYTLPRTAKSHKMQLQRHFYYHDCKNKTKINDDELPHPDTVRNVRNHFENVLKMRSLENVAPHNNNKKLLQKSLSVDVNPSKWSDNASISSGVGSDVSCDTDIELCAHQTVSSEEDEGRMSEKDEKGQPVSKEMLEKIREFGTSITYYGGKIIASSKGHTCSPMTMTIMNEIRRNVDGDATNNAETSPILIKMRLIKSNSCESRLELTGEDDEFQRLSNKLFHKFQDRTIKEEEETNSMKENNIKLPNGINKYDGMHFEEFQVAHT